MEGEEKATERRRGGWPMGIDEDVDSSPLSNGGGGQARNPWSRITVRPRHCLVSYRRKTRQGCRIGQKFKTCGVTEGTNLIQSDALTGTQRERGGRDRKIPTSSFLKGKSGTALATKLGQCDRRHSWRTILRTYALIRGSKKSGRRGGR